MPLNLEWAQMGHLPTGAPSPRATSAHLIPSGGRVGGWSGGPILMPIPPTRPFPR